eukprot:scaffold26198_cov103-Cylindrotheca_fusiformis.AAC.1
MRRRSTVSLAVRKRYQLFGFLLGSLFFIKLNIRAHHYVHSEGVVDDSLAIQQEATSPLITLKKSNRTIFFVHVGKTGGTTLQNNVLLFNCEFFGKNAKRKELCLKFLHQHGESELSKQTTGFMHYSARIPRHRDDIDEMDLLFSLREPIARLASAYEYQNPHNCVPGKKEMGMRQKCGIQSNAMKHLDSFHARFYLQCFPTFTAFVNFNPFESISMNGSHPDEDVDCKELWTEAFQPGLFHGYYHMTANYQYYAEGMQLGPDSLRMVWVIRMERLWQDVMVMDKRVGGSGNFDHVRGRIFNKQTRRTKRIATAPLPFCCTFIPELRVFTKIVYRSDNLKAREKLEYGQKAVKRCN